MLWCFGREDCFSNNVSQIKCHNVNFSRALTAYSDILKYFLSTLELYLQGARMCQKMGVNTVCFLELSMKMSVILNSHLPWDKLWPAWEVFFNASEPYLFVLTLYYLKQHRLYCRKWEDQEKDYQIVNEEPLFLWKEGTRIRWGRTGLEGMKFNSVKSFPF